MKNNTYNQFWKQTSNSQSRLLTVFDTEHGKMQMAFLEAKIPQTKLAADYNSTTFEFNKKIGEMISSTLTNIAMSLSKL